MKPRGSISSIPKREINVASVKAEREKKKEQSQRNLLRKLGDSLQAGAKTTTKENIVGKNRGWNFYSTVEVRSWGSGSHRQLGHGDEKHRFRPELVPSLHDMCFDLSRIKVRSH